MASAGGQEFVAEYRDLLAQLKRNEKRDINVLSMLAEDNRQHAAGIVETIEKHILMVPAPVKLPALYVVDSIVKNVREPYTSLFARQLPEVFGAVWDSMLPDRRVSLSRLFGTWSSVFPPDVLARVKARMAAAAPPPVQQIPVQQIPMQQIPVQQLPLQQLAHHHPHHTVQLPQFQQAPGGAFGGGAPAVVSLPPGGYAPPMQVQLMPPVHLQPPYHPAPQQPVQVVLGGAPPSPSRGAWQQGAPPHDPRLQQHRQPSPGLLYGQPPPQQQQQHFQQQHPQQQHPQQQHQLTNLLSSLAQTGIFGGQQQQQQQQQRRPQDDPALQTTELTAAFLKEYHEGVVAALAEESERTRSAFLDLVFLRKQRQRSGGATSRSWFVTVDHWLTGTMAATEAAQAFGGEEEEAAAEAPPALEPEDPSQPCCAISGEPFDKVYDQEREGWLYHGARRLAGDEAAAHGVPDGALVKVSALAEAAHAPGGGGAAGGGVLDAAGLAADIAAAAAAAGGAGGGFEQQQQQQQQPAAAEHAPGIKGEGGGEPGRPPGAGVKREGGDAAAPEGKRLRAE